jgi:uncharacterized protein
MIRLTIFICMIVGVAFANSQTLAASPSFDCTKATSTDDRAICANDELSSLEKTMNENFKYAMSVGDPGMVRDLARRNLVKRRACKDNIDCLRFALVAAIRSYHDEDTPEPKPEVAASTILDLPSEGSLGVSVADVSEEVAASLGTKSSGALIVKVSENGPAEAAGIKRDDVILKFNGQDITNAQDLAAQVQASARGVYLPVVIVRDGDQGTKIVKIGRISN